MDSQVCYTELRNNSVFTSKVPSHRRSWYAVFTIPRNEKSVVKHLQLRDVESFLPTYESIRLWKNRQRVKTVLPLFPCYLFVHIDIQERAKVLQSPGVLRLIGNERLGRPLEETEIELLRSGFSGRNFEPFHDLVVGERVRIKAGVMQGLEGTLVRRNSNLRFVLSLDLINQHASVEVDAETLESIA